ncbi:MAG: flagellar biosynthesis anti-sigma factor FlgM [Spirochaetaceae bacterium]|jgi:negative regulator of flagellin synthesis FlgM|nr:flagellar biosynthesis anti-sigma factor FlgM [Spirochaetaceae bacterium]
MTIHGVGFVDQYQPIGKKGKAGAFEQVTGNDSIAISPESLEKAEYYRVSEIVASTEDVRADRIAELKQKINDPDYLKDKLAATADILMKALGY